ncbi:hypothetical protein BDF22DRAFT_675637 [Syncephalis plumigaleata]|nr:hypothetical protein BDF22DRAFT_675637 [Syncephalis plumigaleata]
MSRASKITLALSIGATIAIVYGVHRQQQLERETLHEGVIRDRERYQQRQRNMEELEQQRRLQEQLEKEQSIKPSSSNHDKT